MILLGFFIDYFLSCCDIGLLAVFPVFSDYLFLINLLLLTQFSDYLLGFEEMRICIVIIIYLYVCFLLLLLNFLSQVCCGLGLVKCFALPGHRMK